MQNKILSLLLTAVAAVLGGCNSGKAISASPNGNLQFNATTGATGSTCDGVATWAASQVYATAQTKVVYEGSMYTNNWWSQGEQPDTNSGKAGSGKVWALVDNCGVAPVPTPSPSPSPSASPAPAPSPAPTATPVPPTPSGVLHYPEGRGTYTMATVVQASDGLLYQCKGAQILPWCNSTAEWAYAPATGTASNDAWVLYGDQPIPSPVPSPTVSPSPQPTTSPAPSPVPSPTSSPVPPSGQGIVGYYQSWSADWKASGADHSLAQIPPYVSRVLIAFVQPTCTRVAGSDTMGCGLDFSSSLQVVRDAIAVAHKKNPNQKFILSVGGATYPFQADFTAANAKALVGLMNDMGADGIDIDYENVPVCTGLNTNQLSCNTDAHLVGIINTLKAAMPQGKMLTAASWSVGAYGSAKFPTTVYFPQSDYSGLFVNPLKQVGNKLDELYIMSYDAGNISTTGYNPKQALLAYADVLPIGKLYLGLEVPNEAWGGNVLSVAMAQDYASYAAQNKAGGVMLWSLHKVAPTGENANNYLQPICLLYGLSSCAQSVPLH